MNVETPSPSVGPRFHLRQVVMTQGVHALVVSGDFDPHPYLRRHVRGDWGDLCKEDAEANNQALSDSGRLMSSYRIREDLTVWIITEWDRSVTTFLLPSEY